MSRFPKLTETFVLDEMRAVEGMGFCVEVYPLLRIRTRRMHREAVPFVERAHFGPLVTVGILRAHLYYLQRKPKAYLSTLWTLLGATWGSLRYFTGAVVFFPKMVSFAREMAESGVTHVHAHFCSHPAAAAFVIRRLEGIPYSFTAHGSDLHRDRHMLREKVDEASFVAAISNYNRRVILDECGASAGDKTQVIHCGVDTAYFRPRPERRKCSPAAPLSILCTGTLHEVKGQRHLIEACARLAREGFEFRCELVGEGPDRAALAALVRREGLSERIVFAGALTRDQVAARVGRSDVVVAPSVPTANGRREGIPVVLMEAAASGVPVVASRLSGIPELVRHGENGLLTPPGDSLALADALAKLALDPELRGRLGAAGRRRAERDFDLARNAARIARCFGSEPSA